MDLRLKHLDKSARSVDLHYNNMITGRSHVLDCPVMVELITIWDFPHCLDRQNVDDESRFLLKIWA